MENPNFLKKKYNNLHTSLEVESSARRTEKSTKEKLPQNPEKRIQNYLDRFSEILGRDNEQERQQGIDALKKILHKQLIIKAEDVPYRAFELEQDIAEQGGHGRPEITELFKEKKIHEIQQGQEQSLDYWLNYLTSKDADDAKYPDWARYWALRSITELASYDKSRGEFTKRKKDTTKPFPMLHIGAFARVVEGTQEHLNFLDVKNNDAEYQSISKEINLTKQKIRKSLREDAPSEDQLTDLEREELNQKIVNLEDQLSETKTAQFDAILLEKLGNDQRFKDLLSGQNFNKLYSHALEHFDNLDWENLENIKGFWKTFEQGEGADELYDSLQGFPLEWCTANNKQTAEGQLEDGDFHVYYSQDNDGIARIPRLAIRMDGQYQIAEVRGIEKDQNIDQFIQPILDEKLQDFGDEGKRYLKKSHDMEHMTELTQKHRTGQTLSADDLYFLYEIDADIQGFGYKKDPRVEEVKENRDLMSDFEIIFDTKDQNEIAKGLWKKKRTFFEDNMSLFKNLDKKFAKKMIKEGAGPFVAAHLDSFNDLDHTKTALRIIEYGSAAAVAKRLDKFEGVDINALAIALIDAGVGNTLLTNMKKYPELDTETLVEKLIETHNYTALAENLDKFKGLDLNVLRVLLENDCAVDILGNNLTAFERIDMDIAISLLGADGLRVVLVNLDKISDLDVDRLAEKIVDEGDTGALILNTEFFKKLDKNKLALKMIKERQHPILSLYVDKFDNLDLDVVRALFDVGEAMTVARNLESFNEFEIKDLDGFGRSFKHSTEAAIASIQRSYLKAS